MVRNSRSNPQARSLQCSRGMRRVPALILLLLLVAVSMSEAAPGRSGEQQNQAGGRGRGRGRGDITQEPVSVPEPSSLILLGVGSLAVAWWVRQRPKGPI